MIYNLRCGRINVRLCGILPHFPKCFVVNNRPRRVSGTEESSDDIVRLLCIQTHEHPLLRLLDFHPSFGILRNKGLLVGVLLSLQGVMDPRMRSPVVHPERVSAAVSWPLDSSLLTIWVFLPIDRALACAIDHPNKLLEDRQSSCTSSRTYFIYIIIMLGCCPSRTRLSGFPRLTVEKVIQCSHRGPPSINNDYDKQF